MATHSEPKSLPLASRALKKPKPSSNPTTLAYLLENIKDGYYEVDLSGNFKKFNAAMGKIIGHDKDELIGLNYKEYIDPEDTEMVVKIFKEVYETGIPSQAFDWKILRKDGTVRCIETSVSLKRNKTGKPTGFLGIARDVT